MKKYRVCPISAEQSATIKIGDIYAGWVDISVGRVIAIIAVEEIILLVTRHIVE